METFDLTVDTSWANNPENLQKLGELLRANVSPQDCALIFQTSVAAIERVTSNNPTIRAALVESLDNTRYALKKKALNRADNVMGFLYNIAADEEEKSSDRISASKVLLESAGVIGATAQAAEKRMTREVEDTADVNSAAQDTLNRLINHFIDARQSEMQK